MAMAMTMPRPIGCPSLLQHRRHHCAIIIAVVTMRPSRARARPSESSSAANPISRNRARTTSPPVASNPIPSRARPRVATSDLSPNLNDIAPPPPPARNPNPSRARRVTVAPRRVPDLVPDVSAALPVFSFNIVSIMS